MIKRDYSGLNATLISSLKKKIEELNVEKERYSQLFEQSNDTIFLLDFNRKIFGMNKKAEKLTGYNRKELLKMDVSQIYPEQERARFRALFKQSLERGGIRLEAQLLTKDNKIKDIEVCANVVRLKDVSFVQSIIRDITEKKRGEEALKESEEKFRGLFENASDGIFLMDDKGKIVNTNESYAKMHGYDVKEILKTEIKDAETPEARKLLQERLKKAIKGIPLFFEVNHYHKDGHVITLEVSASKIEINGKVFIIAFHRDITERKRAEEALKESESKYRALLENLPQKIFLKDKNLVYISCNKNYADDLKIKAEEIAGKTDYEFYPKDLANKYRADDKIIMESGKIKDLDEEYIQDGQKVYVHTVKIPIKDEKGNVMGILGIFWNITEQKKTEERLNSEISRLESEIRKMKKNSLLPKTLKMAMKEKEEKYD